jgi:hypothetical protein
MAFISPLELKLLELVGCSAADGVLALRPRGPADANYHSTHCPGCARRVSQPLRWFMLNNFRCGCGSEYDSSDCRRWMAAMLKKDYPSADAITTIFRPPLTQVGPDSNDE